MSEKEHEALKTVRKYMWWNIGAGLIPLPLVDLVALSGVQLKMVADISKIYGIPFQASCGKAVVGSLLGAVFPRLAVGTGLNYLDFMLSGAVASLLKTVPLVGPVAAVTESVLLNGGSAWALGKVFIQHFESGGTFLNFKSEEVKEYFRAQLEEGRKLAATMGTEAPA